MFDWLAEINGKHEDSSESGDSNTNEEFSNESDNELYSGDEEVSVYQDVDIFYTNAKVTYGKITTEVFINIPCWAYNRSLDRQHSRKLCTMIIKNQHIHGVVSIVNVDDKLYLIDGQHRQDAIIRAFSKNYDCSDIPIIVAIYEVENDLKAVELFKQINNSKPLTPKDTPDSIIIDVTSQLGKDYPQAIHFDKNKTVYPYLLAKDLQERLRSICLDDITSKKLLSEIRKLNLEYSRMKLSKIPNVIPKLTKGNAKKAQTSGFYLGLDKSWSWVTVLEERLQF